MSVVVVGGGGFVLVEVVKVNVEKFGCECDQTYGDARRKLATHFRPVSAERKFALASPAPSLILPLCLPGLLCLSWRFYCS